MTDSKDRIVNKVSNSKLVSIDLEDYYTEGERIEFDIAPFLFQGIVLKEMDFRTAMKNLDWETYRDKFVAIHSSVDAIIPTWAYMLIATKLESIAKDFFFGDIEKLEEYLILTEINRIDFVKFQDSLIVVKGCSNKPIPNSAYVELSKKLKPYVKSFMYGEPCSTVPVYKRPKK